MRRDLATLVAGDFLLAYAAQALGYALRFSEQAAWAGKVSDNGIQIGGIAGILIFTSYIAGLYKHPSSGNRKTFIAFRVTVQFLISAFILSAIFYATGVTTVGRGVLLISVALFSAFQFVWHFSLPQLLAIPGISRKVLILGRGKLARHIGDLLEDEKLPGLELVGFARMNGEPEEGSPDSYLVEESEVVSDAENLAEFAEINNVDIVVVAPAERRGALPLNPLMQCKLRGIRMIDAITFYEELTGKLLLEMTNPSWFIFSSATIVTYRLKLLKRFSDIVLGLVGSVLALPILPLAALAIRIDSRGPILFRQERVGEYGKAFTLYKLRTMMEDSERETGAVWASEEDPRITRVGNFLRKFRIDEIPQLYNVLKGDMSFIGPRPERPEFVVRLKEVVPFYLNRNYMKPGLTGWAQVNFHYGSTIEDTLEKLRFDLYYIKNYSFLLDVVIIVETVKVVLFGKGGR